MKLYSNSGEGVSDLKKSLSMRLKLLRRESKMTQENLAERLNTTKETIRNWEQKRTLPEYETLLALSEIFNCSFDFLLGRIDCRTHDLQFIHDVTQLSENAIRKLIEDIAPINEGSCFSDIISLLIEDSNSEYFLSIIAKYISISISPHKASGAGKMLPEGMTEIRIAGTTARVYERDLISNLLQSKIIENLSKITEMYKKRFTQSPNERVVAFDRKVDERVSAQLKQEGYQ